MLPRLVEPGIYAYMSDALNKCHDNRVLIYYWILNGGVVLFLLIVAGLYLYYASTKKMTPQEWRNKLIRDHESVLKEIRVYREEKQRLDTLTQLPMTTKQRGDMETNMRPMVFFD